MASQSLDTEPAFCCASVAPYKPRLLDHEACCSAFLDWVHDKDGVRISSGNSSSHAAAPKEFIVQLVRQVNYGKVLSKRYFRHTAAVSDLGSTGKHTFTEINEQDVLLEHFQKLNTFKNFRCGAHDLFFELNIYKHNPRTHHHWQTNEKRPASDIDL